MMRGPVRFRASRYNVCFLWKDTARCFVMNTLWGTGAIVPLRIVKSLLREERFAERKGMDSGVLAQLHELGFVYREDLDELCYLRSLIRGQLVVASDLGLTILPTARCNFDCDYCYEGPKPKYPSSDMSQRVARDVVDFAAGRINRLGGLRVTWYGGEPLLGLKWIRFISSGLLKACSALKRSYSAGIVTNGYLLTAEVARELATQHRVSSVQITIDGPPEVHNTRRVLKRKRGAPTYETVAQNAANAARYIRTVKVRINVGPHNASARGIKEVVDDVRKRAGKYASHIRFHLGYLRARETCDIWREQLPISEHIKLVGALEQYTAVGEEALSVEAISRRLRARFLQPQVCGSVLNPNAFTIDPRGRLHKCWENVLDPESSFGNVSEPVDYSQPNLWKWLGLDLFDYKPCLECSMFPVCLRGCPRHFTTNREKRVRMHQQCSTAMVEDELAFAAWVGFEEHFGEAPETLIILDSENLEDRSVRLSRGEAKA